MSIAIDVCLLERTRAAAEIYFRSSSLIDHISVPHRDSPLFICGDDYPYTSPFKVAVVQRRDGRGTLYEIHRSETVRVVNEGGAIGRLMSQGNGSLSFGAINRPMIDCRGARADWNILQTKVSTKITSVRNEVTRHPKPRKVASCESEQRHELPPEEATRAVN